MKSPISQPMAVISARAAKWLKSKNVNAYVKDNSVYIAITPEEFVGEIHLELSYAEAMNIATRSLTSH